MGALTRNVVGPHLCHGWPYLECGSSICRGASIVMWRALDHHIVYNAKFKIVKSSWDVVLLSGALSIEGPRDMALSNGDTINREHLLVVTLAIEGTNPGCSHHEGPCLLCHPHYCRGLIALSVDGIIYYDYIIIMRPAHVI